MAKGRITKAKALCSKTPSYAHTTQRLAISYFYLREPKMWGLVDFVPWH